MTNAAYIMNPIEREKNSSNLAVVESRVVNMEKVVENLAHALDALRGIASDLGSAIKLLQQSQEDSHMDRMAIRADVELLKTDKSVMRGGWIALCVIGTVFLGLVTCLGVLVAWIAMRKP